MEPSDKAHAQQPARQPAAESATQRESGASIPDSRPSASAQRQLVQAIDQAPRVTAQRRQFEGLGVLQRVVSASATYVPQQAALAEITTLDGRIATAEQTAANEIQNPTGGIHTAYQANYLRAPGAKTWGYCVEEQLNPLAANLGWNTQYVMPNARPDYRKMVGQVEVFADLTTAGQAAPAGNHITGKLAATAHNFNTANWQAADIVHSGQRPGGGNPPPVQTNGLVTQAHAQHFQRYKAYLGANGVYDPVLNHVFQIYGNISSGTFTQTWNRQARDDFVDEFNVQSDSEESDYSIDSDEEML